jgi:DmsE family decaheme c-type cytochrome
MSKAIVHGKFLEVFALFIMNPGAALLHGGFIKPGGRAMSRMYCRILIFACCLFLLSIAQGCKKLKTAEPLLLQREYETMLVGNLEADYVGTETCLAACHEHDRHKRFFDASTMGAQLQGESGMPLIDCETCHGPGSLAIEGLTKELVEENARQGIKTTCDFKTLIDLENLPAPAQSLLCLNCHTANATFNLHNWNSGIHPMNDVSCFDCHDVHHSPDLKMTPKDSVQLCIECHQGIALQFSLDSHHPLQEGRVFCIDCHDEHGGFASPLLREDTVKETCVQCHPAQKGPFLYEHADVMDDCHNCHKSHGSVNPNLLLVRQPYLCLQCHEGHRINERSGAGITPEHARDFFTRCTDCHSTIHGTDGPSISGDGRFTR